MVPLIREDQKRFMDIKWIERNYHVQSNATVKLKDVKMYCNTNQFPALPFCGPDSKPHSERGVSKHYHSRFDTKLSMEVCAIRCIICACDACTSMLDKPWISGISLDKQERYKPATKCTYWPVLGSFNNCNIIEFSSNLTSSDTFDEIHQFVFGLISDNMASLVESVKYVAINTTDTSTNWFHVIMFTSGAYTLQENTKIDGNIITAVEWVVKSQYICSMQVHTNWYYKSTTQTACHHSANTHNTSYTTWS